MSMTPEQMAKAERAIHRKQIQDILRRHALERRNQCIKDVSFFGLPYRVLYSLQQPPDQTPLSRFYPFRACSAETEARVEEALKEARERQGDLSEAEARAIQKEIESIDYTPQDQRDYYFTPFLADWDFSSFKIWDWTGNKIPSAEAARLRQHYTERQKMYMENPERYSPPVLKSADNPERYSQETRELMEMFDNLPF